MVSTNAENEAPNKEAELFYENWTQGGAKKSKNGDPKISVSDFFCGPGGFSYGFKAGIIDNDFFAYSEVAVDNDLDALRTFKKNNNPQTVSRLDLFDGFPMSLESVKYELSHGNPTQLSDFLITSHLRKTDVLLCSPPCRGFSNLNNITRRNDPRNDLLVAALSAAISSNVKTIIIENVEGMRHDVNNVMEYAIHTLSNYGFSVDEIVLRGIDLAIPQTRKRLFIIASKVVDVSILIDELKKIKFSPVSSGFALSINTDQSWDDTQTHFMRTPTNLSEANKARIDHLHDNKILDLPNDKRPDCHKDGHSYPSVYGRIKHSEPSGTITTGFLSPGRGRYIHPYERRGLTLREGARIQSFPDSYEFICEGKKTIAARLIGDAVPPLMSYWIGNIYAKLLREN